LPCRPLNVGKLRENLYQDELAKFPEIDAQRAKLGLAQYAPSRLLAGLVDQNPGLFLLKIFFLLSFFFKKKKKKKINL
jgi:hypothetical protein